MNSSDRALLTAFREIGQMADRLNLPKMLVVIHFKTQLTTIYEKTIQL